MKAPTPIYTAPTRIDTERLILFAADPTRAAAVADYFSRNRDHFAPWNPPLPPEHEQLPYHQTRLTEQRALFDAGSGWAYWLSPRDAPERVIGSANLSNIVRGAFHSCNLGYGIDAMCQGRGLMTEALAALIAAAFSPAANLHRIQAAVRVENTRSIGLIQRLGFQDEGLAREYLYINGQWRDHRIFTRLNSGFVAPPLWLAPPFQPAINGR